MSHSLSWEQVLGRQSPTRMKTKLQTHHRSCPKKFVIRGRLCLIKDVTERQSCSVPDWIKVVCPISYLPNRGKSKLFSVESNNDFSFYDFLMHNVQHKIKPYKTYEESGSIWRDNGQRISKIGEGIQATDSSSLSNCKINTKPCAGNCHQTSENQVKITS